MENSNSVSAAMGNQFITVEVAYALPERQCIKSLTVQEGCTALEAVHASGIVLEFPEIDPATFAMGIFSKNLDGHTLPLAAHYRLKAGERVEIYRPLIADPKVARAQRAARVKATKSRQG